MEITDDWYPTLWKATTGPYSDIYVYTRDVIHPNSLLSILSVILDPIRDQVSDQIPAGYPVWSYDEWNHG